MGAEPCYREAPPNPKNNPTQEFFNPPKFFSVNDLHVFFFRLDPPFWESNIKNKLPKHVWRYNRMDCKISFNTLVEIHDEQPGCDLFSVRRLLLIAKFSSSDFLKISKPFLLFWARKLVKHNRINNSKWYSSIFVWYTIYRICGRSAVYCCTDIVGTGISYPCIRRLI